MVDYAELHPHYAWRQRQGQHLVNNGTDVLGGTKDVDHVDGARESSEARDHRHPREMLPAECGVDPDASEAAAREKGTDVVRWPAWIGRKADHGDRTHRCEKSDKIETRHMVSEYLIG